MGVAQQRLAICIDRDRHCRDPNFADGLSETTPSFGLFGNAGDGAVSVGNMAHPVEVHRLCDHDEQPANPVEFRVGGRRENC